MKQILENFLKMSPEIPNYSEKNQHYCIAGANPLYYKDTSGVEEQQYAPLAASVDWTAITGTIEGQIVHMVTSTEGTYDVYFVTDACHVYGVTGSTVVNMGYPTGGMIGNAGGRLACTAGNLFFTMPTATAIYRMPLPGTGSWLFFGSLSTTSGVHIMEPVLDFIAVVDGTSTTGNLVSKIDVSGFTVTNTGGINIGTGWGVIGMKNYNNKYLAIAAGQTNSGTSVTGYAQNYLFLWNGISSRYNYSVKINGKFIDMKVVNGVLYVAVQVALGKTILYQLKGTTLVEYITPQISQISTLPFPIAQPLFDYKGCVGIHLNSINNLAVTDPLLIIEDSYSGSAEFILSKGYQFVTIVNGYSGVLYGGTSDGVSTTNIYKYNDANTLFQTIVYVSKWIPVQNLRGIDIYYDTPPQSGTDAINVTIYGIGEDIPGGVSTTPLNSITPTSILTAGTSISSIRTYLDAQGFTGDKLKILLTTVNSTWRPIIRRIVPIDDRVK